MSGVSDIVVCTVGFNPMEKERLSLTQQLLDAGFSVELLYEALEFESIEDVQNKCRQMGVPFLVILEYGKYYGADDSNYVKVSGLIGCFISLKLTVKKTDI